MLGLEARHRETPLPSWEAGRAGRLVHADRADFAGLPRGVLITGLVAVGLAAWACYVFGPELARYMKIRRM